MPEPDIDRRAMADPLQPIDHRRRSTWETDRYSGLNQFCNLAVKSQQIGYLETLESVVGRTGIRTHGNGSIRENQSNRGRAKARLATLVYLTDAPRTQIYSIDEKILFQASVSLPARIQGRSKRNCPAAIPESFGGIRR